MGSKKELLERIMGNFKSIMYSSLDVANYNLQTRLSLSLSEILPIIILSALPKKLPIILI